MVFTFHKLLQPNSSSLSTKVYDAYFQERYRGLLCFLEPCVHVCHCTAGPTGWILHVYRHCYVRRVCEQFYPLCLGTHGGCFRDHVCLQASCVNLAGGVYLTCVLWCWSNGVSVKPWYLYTLRSVFIHTVPMQGRCH